VKPVDSHSEYREGCLDLASHHLLISNCTEMALLLELHIDMNRDQNHHYNVSSLLFDSLLHGWFISA
jgi:hypothetical protein